MSGDDAGLLSRSAGSMRYPLETASSALTGPGENVLKRWFLLTGSRLAVTAALLAFVFIAILAMAYVQPIEVRSLLTETTATQTLFSALLSGAILLVSIVVSINSVVLSQEITDIVNQQERITATIEYRRHIEQFIEAEVTPARPAAFLTAVLYAISNEMESIVQRAEEGDNEAFREHVRELASSVERDIDRARDTLADARIGTFSVLLAGLNYDYSAQLHAARSLKREFGDALGDEEQDDIDDLIDALKHIATGREYFKSLYYERELARLSSVLLFVSLPVIVFTSFVILALDEGLFPDVSVLGFSPLLLSVTFAYTVALAPYVVLTAYIVRVATITLRTLAAGPFILQPGSELEAFQWEDPDDGRDWELTEHVEDE